MRTFTVGIFAEQFFARVSCMMRYFQNLALNLNEDWWLLLLSFKKVTTLEEEVFSERHLSLVLGQEWLGLRVWRALVDLRHRFQVQIRSLLVLLKDKA